MRTARTLAVPALLLCAFLVSTRSLPAPLPRPVICATDAEARAAMRSAPVIVVVRITDLPLTGDELMVLYASGFDEELRRAACSLAAADPEIPPLSEYPTPDTSPRLE